MEEPPKNVIPSISVSFEQQQTEKYKNNEELEKEARNWIEAVTGEKLQGSFASALKNGVLLCKLFNKIKPKSITKINSSDITFKQMENLNHFLRACSKIGMPQSDLFMTIDLYEEKDLNQVIFCIHALGRHYCKMVPGYNGPVINPAHNAAATAKLPPRKRSIRSPSPPTVQINSETIQREIEEEKKRLEMREAEKKAIEGELTPENALRERNTWLLEENARLKMELKRKEEELNSALKKLAELKTKFADQENDWKTEEYRLHSQINSLLAQTIQNEQHNKNLHKKLDSLQSQLPNDLKLQEDEDTMFGGIQLKRINTQEIAALKQQQQEVEKKLQQKEEVVKSNNNSKADESVEVKENSKVADVESKAASGETATEDRPKEETAADESKDKEPSTVDESVKDTLNHHKEEVKKEDDKKSEENHVNKEEDKEDDKKNEENHVTGEDKEDEREIPSNPLLEDEERERALQSNPLLSPAPEEGLVLPDVVESLDFDQLKKKQKKKKPDKIQRVNFKPGESPFSSWEDGNDASTPTSNSETPTTPPKTNDSLNIPEALPSSSPTGHGSFGVGSGLELLDALNAMSNLGGEYNNTENERILRRETRAPSFLEIFERQPIVNDTMPEIRNWVPGEAIIREHSVTADVNKKAERRVNKKTAVMTGERYNKEMEDFSYMAFPFGSDKNRALFCVFDGHGGKNCSSVCVDVFPKVSMQLMNTLTQSQELQSFLGDAPLTQTDLTDVFTRVFLEVDKKLERFEYEGSTATTVFIWQAGATDSRYLQAANVGDSTAYLKRKDEILRLTFDHHPNEQVEVDRLKRSGIEVTPGQKRLGGLAVSRSIGDHFLKQEKLGVVADPYVSKPIKLQPTDSIVILASDGLWDVMTPEHAMELAIKKMPKGAEAISRRLIQTALQHKNCLDNITVMAVIL